MLSNEAKSALRRIRAEVLEGHWMKHNDYDGKGNYCLAGHVNHQASRDRAGRTMSSRMEVHQVLLEVVQARGYLSIPRFNDNPYTTQDDIIAVIDEAMRSQ